MAAARSHIWRRGIALSLGAGVGLAITVGALAQVRSSDTQPPGGDDQAAFPVDCSKETSLADTFVTYLPPKEGETRTQQQAVEAYVALHDYRVAVDAFAFEQVSANDQIVNAAVVREGEDVKAVAYLGELADEYWAVTNFSVCEDFELASLAGAGG